MVLVLIQIVYIPLVGVPRNAKSTTKRNICCILDLQHNLILKGVNSPMYNWFQSCNTL